MSHRKFIHAFMMSLVLTGMAISAHGCKESPDTSAQAASTSIALCVKCGQIEGSALSCGNNR